MLCIGLAMLGYFVEQDPTTAARRVRLDSVHACQRTAARFGVVIAFFHDAAAAREKQARISGSPAARAADRAAARTYRRRAARLQSLTPRDCEAAFPRP